MSNSELLTWGSAIRMACECELLSNVEGEVHPYPAEDSYVCLNSTYVKVQDKYRDNLWLCDECIEHNC